MNEDTTIDDKMLKEKQELIKDALEHLSQITSIGNSTILIEKTKLIIHICKQLLQGFDELTINKTSSYVTMLVSNTKIIAADPTVVTADAIKSLSRSRDKLLNQLLEINTVLEQNYAHVYDSLHRSAGPSQPVDEDKERELLEQLAKQRGELRAKKSVQQAFILEGDPATMLEEVVAEFLSSTKSLEESYAPGNNPSRSEIHLSLCGISRSVLRLLDLIDSLFVSKFPMRKQVYTFTEKLIELGMAYKPVDRKGSREGEAISDMRKQLPALQNSAKVMLAQLEERVRNLTASRQKSMKRRQDLTLVGSREFDKLDTQLFQRIQKEGNRSTRCLHLRLICHVCCTSAKQASNGEPIKRGSVLRLEVSGDASIRELKEQLSKYTGIPVKYVLPRFPGVNQPTNNEVELGDLFEGGDMRDVFLFDLSSSEGQNEDELRELRRLAVAQMSIDDYDWAEEWAGDITQATVDYDVTESGHLSFIEGELVKVLERSSDGWWRGEVNGVQGIFYKTFVQELYRESSSSIPTNFKQVKFSVKKKESHLTRKKSDEEPAPVPPEKKFTKSVLQEGKPQTPDMKKKASHFSIELDEPPGAHSCLVSVPKADPIPQKPDFPASDRAALVGEKESSSENKPSNSNSNSNRVASLDIDELLDQLSEYSGIPVPETPNEPLPPSPATASATSTATSTATTTASASATSTATTTASASATSTATTTASATSDPTSAMTVPSITNLGFGTESPVTSPKDSSQETFTSYTSSTTSSTNPLFSKSSEFGQVYDSLFGVKSSSKLEDDSASETEENPLYEKVEAAPEETGADKRTESTEPFVGTSIEYSETASPCSDPPPLPTTSRPPKPSVSIQPPPSATVLPPKFKPKPTLAKKSKLSSAKGEKDKAKPEKKKRNFFGKKQKSIEGSILPEEPPLAPVSAPANNASSNNSNQNPIFEDTFTPQQPPNMISSVYEEIDRAKVTKPTPQSKERFSQSQPQGNNAESKHSRYEEVAMLLTPPPKSNLEKAETIFEASKDDDIGPQIVVGEHMYSQIGVKPNSTNKSENIEMSSQLALSIDELSSGLLRNTPVGIREVSFSRPEPIAPESQGQLSPGIKSCPIYSQITRKRDSIIIQDEDDTPVAVNVTPERESNGADPEDNPQEFGDTLAASRPILPPKTLTIEDVEVYINEKEEAPDEEAIPPSPNQATGKRVSHYYEINTSDSPPLAVRALSQDDTYEVVENRPRSHSTPQRKAVEHPVKTPLEHSQSAAHSSRVLIPAKDIELPLIPTTEQDANDAYESIDCVMGASAKFSKKQCVKSNPTPMLPPVIDVRSMYTEALLVCISNLILIKVVNCTLFSKDNSQQTKRILKSLEMGQSLNVDYRTPPSILASLVRQMLKADKIGPLFSVAVTEQLFQLVKSDRELSISGYISSVSKDLTKFIRDFIYFLYLNLNDLNEKKKQEFIVSLSPLFFEDTSKKNMDACKHILRYLVEHYSIIFQN